MLWLVDTNILIDRMRGKAEALRLVEERLGDLATSSLVIAELYQGVRDHERAALDELRDSLVILDVTTEIAEQGGLYARQFRSSHSAGLIDCLIAATASQYGLQLVSLNSKHFPMLTNVEVPYTP
jgi:predicted nucleic acid-binding protein